MKTITSPSLLCFFLFTLLQSLLLSHTTADHDTPSRSTSTSIIFATFGRSNYAFDIYTLLIPAGPQNPTEPEFRITDGQSVNFNGHFPSPSSTSSLLCLSKTPSSPPPLHLVYVTERNGSSSIYLDTIFYDGPDRTRKRSILQVPARVQVPLLSSGHADSRFEVGPISMKDRPIVVGDYLVYVSTHENTGVARTSWAAVYSTHLKTGLTRRLTPYGVADFSPAVSPTGVWTAVASGGERGWGGEIEELDTDIYVFRTADGSGRVKLVKHGGWPSWADESTLYFHRRGEDGWWSVFRASLVRSPANNVVSVVTQRVTPPGLHAFTPAASVANKSFIAVATRRPGSEFRHIELYDVVAKEFMEITRPVSPQAHHYNPFVSPDSKRIGYHRCRGANNGRESNHLLLENIQSPLPDISLFRIDGSFPSVSPDGNRIAFVKLPGLYVMNRDGSGLRQLYPGTTFSTAWDPIRKGVVYSNVGPSFATESTKVDVISVNVDDGELRYKRLTTGGENNAFPSPSPDGKWLVFRSGRSGHKNLYIMDALEGEKGGLHRLTEGPWTDTMCNWSPNGDWIAFASDRENPGSGSFELFLIHSNGTGLKKLVQSGSGGRTNHPWFSPDGEKIVFTSDYAAVSAEPISNPHHYQPYGNIFTIRLDGSGMTRLTHNSFEDGTPTWGPTFIRPVDVGGPIDGPHCSFDDCHWLKNTFPNRGPEVLDKAQCGL
jgi:Tol biopolymer transport system component